MLEIFYSIKENVLEEVKKIKEELKHFEEDEEQDTVDLP